MSALGHKATSARLFDHLVGASNQRCRKFEAKRLGGLKVDNEFKLGRLFDGNIARLYLVQNFVGQVGGAAELIGKVGAPDRQRPSRKKSSGGDARPVCF